MLEGKTALITGATGGLGSEIARALALAGCKLVLSGRNLQKLEEIGKELQVSVKCIAADLSKDADIDLLLEEKVDILVNNAGVFPIKTISESTTEDFDKCFAVNVRAPFILSREYGQSMCEKGWGRIVNIGSSSSYNGSGETGVYCASKHALLGLSRSLYQEYKRHGVRVYSVSPGSIQTSMGATDTRQDYSTFINPREIAEYIWFVMSYDNEMVSEEIRLNRYVVR